MPTSRYTYLWVQNGIPARRFLNGESAPLRARLEELAQDQERGGESLVLDAAHALFGWALEHDASWEAERAGADLEAGLAEFEQRHGWRGPVALFLDCLRLAWRHSAEGGTLVPRSALSEEAGFWIWSQREDLENWPDMAVEWNGRALAPGRRMPARAELAREAAAQLELDETLLVHGYSEGLARALEEAQRAGKRPRVLCGEGLPLLTGRRLARRLAPLELPFTLVYDAQLADLVPEADRVWIASEAVGAHALLAQAGARRLAREAVEHDVPLQVVAASDALLPGGALAQPRWMAEEAQLLWVEAPRNVELRTAFLEELPLPEVPEFLTEKGRERAEALCLRALRLERAPHCGAPAAAASAWTRAAVEPGVLRPVPRAAHERSDEDQRTRTPN
jgi:Initiation factor 2 subunit family